MKITSISIFRSKTPDSSVKASLVVIFDNAIAVHGITLIQTKKNEQFFISMPTVRSAEGSFEEIFCHPINSETRKMILDAAIQSYQSMLEDQDRCQVKLEDSSEEVKFSNVHFQTPKDNEDENLVAFASIQMDESFVFRNIEIRKKTKGSQRGLYISMPVRKLHNGEERDAYNPINIETRAKMKQAILSEYASRQIV